jgi:hypothetical protein
MAASRGEHVRVNEHERQVAPVSRSAWIGLCIVTLAGLALRWPAMGRSLWYDEIWRTKLVLNADNARAVLLGDVHNPLYNTLMYGWIRVFGDSETSIRLPSLLCGFAAVWMFGLWVSRRFGETVGLLVAAWLMVHPFHIWHSTEAKNNAFLAMFAVGTLIAFDRLVGGVGSSAVVGVADSADGRRPWGKVACAVGMGLGAIGTSWSGVLAVLVAGVGAVVVRPHGVTWRDALRRVSLAIGLIVLALSPLLWIKAGQVEALVRAHPRHFDWREAWLFVGNYLTSGNGIWPVQAYEAAKALEQPRLWWTVGQGAMVAGLLVLAARLCLRTGREEIAGRSLIARRRAAVCFGLTLLLVFATSAVLHWVYSPRRVYIYQERNLLWLLYPFALLVIGAAWSARPWLRAVLLVAVFAAPIIGQAMISTVNRSAWTIYKPNPDWRGAAATIRELARSVDQPVVTVEYATTPCDPLSYYLPEGRRVVSEDGSDIRETARRVMAEPGGPQHVFITSQEHWWPLDDAWMRRGEYYLAGELKFDGISVYHVYRKDRGQ